LDPKHTFVSFYTKNSPYEQHAQNLKSSLEAHNLNYDIQEIESKETWSANSLHKPAFLLEMLEKHKSPLIWTDADTQIHSRPDFFDTCFADISLRINDFTEDSDPKKIQTHTLFINNTASAKKLLLLWNKECKRRYKKDKVLYDCQCLKSVILHYPTIVEIKRLPINYCTLITKDNPHALKHATISRQELSHEGQKHLMPAYA
jgi:hypothetical protein